MLDLLSELAASGLRADLLKASCRPLEYQTVAD